MKKLIEAPDLTKKRKLKIAPGLVIMPEEPPTDVENIKELQATVTKITNTLNDVLSRTDGKEQDSINRAISGLRADLVFIQSNIRDLFEKITKGEGTKEDIKKLVSDLSLLMIRIARLEKNIENIEKLQIAINKITTTLTDIFLRLKENESKVKGISIRTDLFSLQDKIKSFTEKIAKGESIEKDVKELTSNLSLLIIRVEKLEQDTTVTAIKEDLKTIHKTLEFFKDLMDSLYSRTSYYGGGGGGGVPATTVVSETSFDASPAVGVSVFYAREDHTHGTPAIGIKNPPIDADKALYRDSTSSDALVTSTWTQIKAFLKTYWDTLYEALGAVAAHALLTATHGVAQIAGLADIVAHAGITTGIHGVAASTIASIANIATHAALTATHGATDIADVSDIAVDANLSAAAQAAIAASHTQNTDTDLDATFEATFEKVANKGAISGYAPLDVGQKVPTVNLGGAGADNTKYLRGDQSWQVPAGGGSDAQALAFALMC